MSGPTPLQIKIVLCPEDQVSEILKIIDDYDLVLDIRATVPGNVPQDDHLYRNELYINSAASPNSAEEIASLLQANAPDAAWEVQSDPTGERLGQVYRFTSKLGLWIGTCVADGTAVFTVEEVIEFLDDRSLSRNDIDRRLGVAHTESFEESLTTAAACRFFYDQDKEV